MSYPSFVTYDADIDGAGAGTVTTFMWEKYSYWMRDCPDGKFGIAALLMDIFQKMTKATVVAGDEHPWWTRSFPYLESGAFDVIGPWFANNAATYPELAYFAPIMTTETEYMLYVRDAYVASVTSQLTPTSTIADKFAAVASLRPGGNVGFTAYKVAAALGHLNLSTVVDLGSDSTDWASAAPNAAVDWLMYASGLDVSGFQEVALGSDGIVMFADSAAYWTRPGTLHEKVFQRLMDDGILPQLVQFFEKAYENNGAAVDTATAGGTEMYGTDISINLGKCTAGYAALNASVIDTYVTNPGLKAYIQTFL
jgi:hypothetical protein